MRVDQNLHQKRGCDAAKSGVKCKTVDAATRDYIADKGYGDTSGPVDMGSAQQNTNQMRLEAS